MNKSDLAQQAARYVRERLVLSGDSAEELLSKAAEEYEIDAGVLRAWILREFESLEALDSWAATRRDDIQRAPELEKRRIERFRDDQRRAIAAQFAQILTQIRELPRKTHAQD